MPKYISSIQHHFNIGPGIYLLNREVRKAIRNNEDDILLIDNKSYITKQTLNYVRKIRPRLKIANLLTDDPFGKYTKSFGIIKKTAAQFDIIFVQREVNINEFKMAGARRVELCYRSFDPGFNRPFILRENEDELYKTKVGFVGTYENVRASYIAFLITNNIPVSVTGNGWPNQEYWDIIKPYYKGPSVYGEKYIKTINGMDIALHFLRHANRDEQDSRTFEIPACGVFMLAEKSKLHESLFEPGKEAEFFTTKEQLLEKVKYYLQHVDERKIIAQAGFTRCMESGYSHEARLKEVINKINSF